MALSSRRNRFSETLSRLSKPASLCETTEAPGGKGEIGLEQTLELEKRLVIEDDVIDLPAPETRFP